MFSRFKKIFGSKKSQNDKTLDLEQINDESSEQSTGDTMMATKDMELAQQYLSQGNDYLKTDRLDEAITCFRIALDYDVDYLEAYNRLGQGYERQKNWSSAVRCYQQALERHPEAPWVYLRLGDALRKEGQGEEALRICHQAEQQENVASGIFRLLGNLMDDNNQIGDAINCYRKFSELQPNNANAYALLANACNKDAQWEEMLHCCEQAEILDTVNSEIFRLKAIALRQLNRHEEAIDPFRRFLELRPTAVGPYVALGDCLLRTGKFDDVIALKSLVQQNQIEAPALSRMFGVACQRKGKWSEAITHYETFLGHKPDAIEVYVALGDSLLKNGQVDEVFTLCHRAKQQANVSPGIDRLLGSALLEKERFGEAIDHFQSFINQRPQAVGAYVSLGRSYWANYQFDQAIQSFQYALEQGHAPFFVTQLLGDVYDANNQKDIAIDYYEKALELKPNNASVSQKLQMLRENSAELANATG